MNIATHLNVPLSDWDKAINKVESQKISYLKSLIKKATTVSDCLKAINYGLKYERCLNRSNEVKELLEIAYESKQNILKWNEFCSSQAVEKHESKIRLHKEYKELGLPNNCYNLI